MHSEKRDSFAILPARERAPRDAAKEEAGGWRGDGGEAGTGGCRHAAFQVQPNPGLVEARGAM